MKTNTETEMTIHEPSAVYGPAWGPRYIALPIQFLRSGSGADWQLREAFAELISEWCGEGRLVLDRDGVRVFDLIVTDEGRAQHHNVPAGDWIVRYSYDQENGSSVMHVWVAARIETKGGRS